MIKNHDFVKYAESYGARGYRPKNDNEFIKTFQKCLQEDGVHLIETDSPHKPTVAIHQVQIAHLRPIAVDRLDTPSRTEQDVVVRQQHKAWVVAAVVIEAIDL